MDGVFGEPRSARSGAKPGEAKIAFGLPWSGVATNTPELPIGTAFCDVRFGEFITYDWIGRGVTSKG